VRERPTARTLASNGHAAGRALWPLGGGGGGGGVSTGGGGGVSSGGGGCTAGGGSGATPPGAGTVGRSERDGNCTAPVTMPCAPRTASGAAPGVPTRAGCSHSASVKTAVLPGAPHAHHSSQLTEELAGDPKVPRARARPPPRAYITLTLVLAYIGKCRLRSKPAGAAPGARR